MSMTLALLNRIFFCCCFLLLFKTEVFAQGSSGAGNGGKVIACATGTARPTIKNFSYAKTLDYWQMEIESNKLHLDLGKNDPSLARLKKKSERVDFKVKWIIDQVRRLDTDFASELADRYKQFKKISKIEDHFNINKINDTKLVIDKSELNSPKGNCIEFQGAKQIRDESLDEFFNIKFFIDADIWKIMSANDQAGLIFHEILYWSEITRGATDSEGTRKLNAIFSSDLAREMTLPEYLHYLRKYSLRSSFVANGALISTKKVNEPGLSIEGKIISGYLLKPFSIMTPWGTVLCLKDKIIEFDETGQVQECSINEFHYHFYQGPVHEDLSFSGQPSSLKEILHKVSKQQVTGISLSLTELSFTHPLIHYGLEIKPYCSEIELYPNGSIKRIHISDSHFVDQVAVLKNISFINTALSEIDFDEKTLQPLSFQVSNTNEGVSFLIDHFSKMKYELSWKNSGQYLFTLDPHFEKIEQVK